MKYIGQTIIVFLIFISMLPASKAMAYEAESASASMVISTTDVADPRVAHLKQYLSTHNSPIANEAEWFISEADRLGLDWKLVAAIAGVESTFGKHIPSGSYNAWGWGIPTGAQSGIAFANWESGITTVSEGLRKKYIDKGAITIEQMGRIYAASPAWPAKVRYFLNKIETFAPTKPDHLVIRL